MPYTFNLPSIGALSRGQRIALLATIEDAFIISGCPGSGKTTVALLRAKGKQSDPKSHYTVWANLLYGYLVNLAPELQVHEDHFSTFYSWLWRNYQTAGFQNNGAINIDGIVRVLKHGRLLYDELQLDEGQDLPTEVRCALTFTTKKLVICMDPAQDVNDQCKPDIDEIERTKKLLESYGKNVRSFKLTTNWRNTQPIFEFAKAIVPELNSQTDVADFSKQEGKKPILYEFDNFKNIVQKIKEVIRNEPGRNIGVLDDSLEKLHAIKTELTINGIQSTLYDSREHRRRSRNEQREFLTSMHNVVLSTFISCKGLEFNTVIISDIAGLSDSVSKKKGYYVGCTRAQDRLILFKDSSKYTVPNWFQQIDRNLYELIREKQVAAPF